MNKTGIFLLVLMVLSMMAGGVSALTVTDAQGTTISPGQEGEISIYLENTGSKSIEEISVSIDLTNIPFIPVGSSEASIEKLNEDKEKVFSFSIRASSDAKPGDYKVPYLINAKNTTQKKGTLGVRVTGDSKLSFSLNSDVPVVGHKAKLTLKTINSGLTDAKFVSLKIIPNGMTILSEDKVYIGTIGSDDFETSSFEAIFNKINPTITVFLSYQDFNNKEQTITEEVSLTVYSYERALELGIVKKNNTLMYVSVVLFLIVFWIVWRNIRKRQRLKRSKELAARD